jgi:hypothetical protein
MRNIFILAVVCVSLLWASDASALCGRKPVRKAGKVVVTAAVRPVGKVLKAVGKVVTPFRHHRAAK